MSNIERLATSATNGMSATIAKLRTLATGLVVATVLIAALTFVTGWWVFRRNHGGWLVIGGILCLIPVVAVVVARLFVGASTRAASTLMSEVRQLIGESRHRAGTLIDHDSGTPLGQSAKSFRELRGSIVARRGEFPALFAGVRAIASVPGLLAIAVLGTLALGVLGTILLIVGLAR